ncbi:histidine kinase [Agromyces sp. NPDC058136]|uniref:histidine kinase n=1 Tax=Agromyces sp. NPDC058136 TaxID=3346354 RepID=UPI0036DEBCBC
MELSHYVDELHRQLAIAAEAGGDDARQLAERLTAPLDAAARLVLLEALSAAAGEITVELAPGSVEVRLRGREPEFVVSKPAQPVFAAEVALPTPPAAPAAPVAPAPLDDEGGTSRTTLRLPDHLKARVEEAAARDGLSVNTWLVRAVGQALEQPTRVPNQQAQPASRGARGGERLTGWVR